MLPRPVLLASAMLVVVPPAAAQIISIRTVPISQSHQFDYIPSLRRAMGGASIALSDSLADPFANPAKGARLRASSFFGAPGVYSVSLGAGAGRTLPLGTMVRRGDWFGVASVALQEVDLSDQPNGPFPFNCPVCDRGGVTLPSPDRTHRNGYGQVALGRVLGRGLAVGGSVAWADINGVDGVDLLYPGNARLAQYGNDLDLRVGLLKDWVDTRSFSAVLVHNRYATTHDVYYLDGFWDPGTQGFAQRPRLERNHDDTRTWGLQLEYAQPMRVTGWRIGGTATANVATHPKIPNYEIQNIPRDPGNSEAFNLGIGIARETEFSTFGLDLVYEPIWSYTWADAAAPIVTGGGTTIPVGGKTIENRFRFSNALLRMGFAQEMPFTDPSRGVGVKFGLLVRSIDYTLQQRDNVQLTSRRLDEDWIEWSPTWGLSLRFPAWEIRYRGSVTNGTGRPGVVDGGVLMAQAEATRNILVAPSGPLTLTRVKVMTHQVSVSFPLR